MKAKFNFIKKIWPGLKKLVIYSAWAVFLYSVFFLTYMPVNRFNAYRDVHWHLYLSWETQIAIIPEFMLFYASIIPAFVLPLFLLKIADIHLLAFRFLMIMLTSMVIFLIFPTVNGFPREVPEGIFQGIFSFLFHADKPYNLFPSLHISFSATLAMSMMKLRSKWLKALIWIWLFFICVSVVVVHQHHLADIAGGLALSYLSMGSINGPPKFFTTMAEKIYRGISKN
jgi:membrane-associated phospholipid phosphatase